MSRRLRPTRYLLALFIAFGGFLVGPATQVGTGSPDVAHATQTVPAAERSAAFGFTVRTGRYSRTSSEGTTESPVLFSTGRKIG